ncbi:MAG: endolytic transglycosylase MltG [Flavobacteriales bacterium]|nr:endolytic transglycosylase MltG [Flavobacteriales bacterium]
MKKWLLLLLVLGAIGGLVGWRYYSAIFGRVTRSYDGKQEVLVPTGADFEELVTVLKFAGVVTEEDRFRTAAELKDFHDAVKPGRYLIPSDMSYHDLINKLRIGDQDPVELVFSEVRLYRELPGLLSRNIELDSLELDAYMMGANLPAQYGFNATTFPTMFIPNTYSVYWNISKEELIDRMAREYKSFWNADRLTKARNMGLSQSEVTILASIVKAETAHLPEAPRIAGVYANRLRQGIPLQADPTLVFALGDFSIRRVLDRHKEIDSPYNTYRYAGLPPGPINIPNGRYIDAVLNAEKHEFLYFCASPEMDGTHLFARTYNQHLANARKYQNALNQRGIYR